jgi:hypothetical protein
MGIWRYGTEGGLKGRKTGKGGKKGGKPEGRGRGRIQNDQVKQSSQNKKVHKPITKDTATR